MQAALGERSRARARRWTRAPARWLLGEPRLAAEARDVAIRLPGLELPGIDDLFPFGQQEAQAERVARHGCRGFLEQLAGSASARATIAACRRCAW